MALFKILRGPSTELSKLPIKDGYCYFTPDTGLFHIDYNGTRVPLNASDAETLMGATLAQVLNNNELEIPSSALIYQNNIALNNGISAAQAKADEAYELAGVQSDQSVNDPEDPAYVKNRTHYVKDIVLEETPALAEQTLTINEDNQGFYLQNLVLFNEDWTVYQIKFNETIYNCSPREIVSDYGQTIILLGNGALLPEPFYDYSGIESNEPFLIACFIEGSSSGGSSYLFIEEFGECVVEIYEGWLDVQLLDSVFIGDDIARTKQLENYSKATNLEDGYGSGLKQISAKHASASGSVAMGINTIALGTTSYSEGYGNYSSYTVNGEGYAVIYTVTEAIDDIYPGYVICWNDSNYATIISCDKTNKTITLDTTLYKQALVDAEVKIYKGGLATGSYSHNEGYYTIASGDYQHVQGKNNIQDLNNEYSHIVGNGENSSSRSNAHTIDWDGNAWFAGDVYIGSTSGTNKDEGSIKLATIDEALDVFEGYFDGEVFTDKNGNIIEGETGKLYVNLNEKNEPLWISCSSGNKGLYYSTNGINWIQSNITSGTFYYAYYNNGTFVSCGDNGLYYSTDGINWTLSNLQQKCMSIYYGNGIWVTCGGSGIYYSTDGINWIQSNITSAVYSIHYDNNIWVGCGTEGNGLYYSTDGISWTLSNITQGFNYSACYGNNIWVVASSDGPYYSTDGMNWTRSNVDNRGFYSVHYDNNIWVATTDFGGSGFYYSTDGINWIQSNITYTSSPSGVYYGGNIWVAFTNEDVYYSTDGMNWTKSNITGNRFQSFYYNDGLWIASSFSGLYYSNDGMNWTKSNITSGIFYSAYRSSLTLPPYGGVYRFNGQNFVSTAIPVSLDDYMTTDEALNIFVTSDEALSFKVLTREEYEALEDKDPNTMYVLSDDNVVEDFSSHVENDTIHVTADDKSNWNGHIIDTNIHVTAAEKEKWNNAGPASTTITLFASGWTTSDNVFTQSVAVSGISADELAQKIDIMPVISSQGEYINNVVYASAQAENSLTFTAKTQPAADLNVFVIIWELN